MRQRLLEATIDCLVEYGYAGTTTTRVAERAGVTRGAQLHHFRTKNDLVTAAVRHLAVKRADAALEQVDRLRGSDDVLDAALDLLWDVHQGPIFAATAELWMAARTDPDLQAQLRQVEPMVNSALLSFGAELVPGFANHPQLRHWAYTAMDVVRGLLVGSGVIGDAQLEQRWRRAKAHLKIVGEQLLADAGATYLQP
ncbi:TetR/AcrR family transcriptional regulator [Amycolatopsis suaedae]|uniref:TetR/AcrR family transcriptional regulator n=2 Tax=Amycolatopsis suaedae TaxID=2510978 RepID=A0A4Q7IYS9_9PSEU|nr:TetR/AcrR family transcriptional regulator [Amycolatopsis suaedae]RZQ59598.1 TetR/AcrR family transcriptional regulator [Amycolatopsis suaedae]